MNQRIYTHLQQALADRQHLTEIGVTFIFSSSEEQFVSYHELYKKASQMLGALQRLGIQKGNELVIQTGNNGTFLTLFWAAILGGIIPVPLHFATADDLKLKLATVLQILENPYLIVEEDKKYGIRQYLLEDPGSRAIDAERIFDFEQIDSGGRPGQLAAIAETDLAFIQFSSGSTGSPKGVCLTHKNLCANIYDILAGSGITAEDVLFSWMPFTHDMGLIGMHFSPLFLGAKVFNLPTNVFIRHPLLWLHKMHEHRVTVTQSPNFGYHFVMSAMKKDMVYDWDLSCIRIIFNGAEPISVYICREFLDTFQRYGLKRTVMFAVYGLAEATLAVSFPQPETCFKSYVFKRASLQPGLPVEPAGNSDNGDQVELVSVGRPLQQVSVRICNDNDEVIPDRCTGHIQIKGASVSERYYGDTTFAHFSADGWLKTGDLGCFYEGELIVTGRSKELIIVNGQNFYPYDLESKLCAILDIAYGKIVVGSARTTQTEQVLVFVQFRRNIEAFVAVYEQVRDIMTVLTGAPDCLVLPVQNIPKTTSGKIQRGKLVEMHADGRFQAAESTLKAALSAAAPLRLESDNPQELNARIISFLMVEINKLLPEQTDLEAHKPLMELGINSKHLVLLTGKLSRFMGAELPTNIFFHYPTLSLLATHLTGLKLGNAPGEAPRDVLYDKITGMSDEEIAAILEADDFL